MKRLFFVALVACRGAASDAPARVEPVVGRLDAGEPAVPSSAQPSAKERCEEDMPEQSCVPGCEGVPHQCAQGCSAVCGSCVDGCGGNAACEAGCLTRNDRCRTADCGKEAADCQAEAAANEKRNYGCKLPFPKACKKHVACTAKCDHAPPGDAMQNCYEACKKRTATGCDDAFLTRAALIGCSEHEAP